MPPARDKYREYLWCEESGGTVLDAGPNLRPPRHSWFHWAGLRADERIDILAVAPSHDPNVAVRSGSDSIVSNQGLRFDSITVAGAAPEWV